MDRNIDIYRFRNLKDAKRRKYFEILFTLGLIGIYFLFNHYFSSFMEFFRPIIDIIFLILLVAKIVNSYYKSKHFVFTKDGVIIHRMFKKKFVPWSKFKTAFLLDMKEAKKWEHNYVKDLNKCMYGVFLSTKEWDLEQIYRKTRGPRGLMMLETWWDLDAMSFCFPPEEFLFEYRTKEYDLAFSPRPLFMFNDIPPFLVDGKVMLTLLERYGVNVVGKERFVDIKYERKKILLKDLRAELGIEEAVVTKEEITKNDENVYTVKCKECGTKYSSDLEECPACVLERGYHIRSKFILSKFVFLVEFLFLTITWGDLAFKLDILPFYNNIEKEIMHCTFSYAFGIPAAIIGFSTFFDMVFHFTDITNFIYYFDISFTFIYVYIVMSMGGAVHFYEPIVDRSIDFTLFIPVICFIIRKLDREFYHIFINDRIEFLNELKKEDRRRVEKREGREEREENNFLYKRKFGKCLECGYVYDIEIFKCPDCGKISHLYIFIASAFLSTASLCLSYRFFKFGLYHIVPRFGEISYNFLKIYELYKVPYMILIALTYITFLCGFFPFKREKALLNLLSKVFMIMDLIIVLTFIFFITHLSNVTFNWQTYCAIIFGILMIPTQYFFIKNYALFKEMIVKDDEK